MPIKRGYLYPNPVIVEKYQVSIVLSDPVSPVITTTRLTIRDWSLITRQGKTFCAPLLKSGNFRHPPLQYG